MEKKLNKGKKRRSTMGYTRYFELYKIISEEKFEQYSATCKLICEKIQEIEDYKLGDWEGTEKGPVFDENEVSFNGIGDDAHETFSIRRDNVGFVFTKTNRKDYDSSVCACLYLAKQMFGNDIRVSDDGDNNDDEVEKFIKQYIRDFKINNLIK
jgi:hypothetical protein